jgi:flagellar biosynthesis/type III secretory pathway protein FliH
MRLEPLYQQDREQAKLEGKQEGKHEGRQEIIEDLLQVRFGTLDAILLA